MIGRLCGKLLNEEAGGPLLLDVGGVGYDVLCPLGTAGRARQDGDRVVLHVHTNLRQDALELFGFATEEDRAVFRLLIGVPNVGPRTALGILSALPTPELCAAVQAADKNRLGKVPGIGKKTAERLVLELKDKLPTHLGRDASAEKPTPSPALGQRDRLLAALTNMGYRAADAERALKALEPELETRPLSDSLREALKILTP